MHKSVHKSTVPDSYTLLFDVKSYYLNGFCSHVRYVGLCMHVCTKSTLKTQKKHIPCVSACNRFYFAPLRAGFEPTIFRMGGGRSTEEAKGHGR